MCQLPSLSPQLLNHLCHSAWSLEFIPCVDPCFNKFHFCYIVWFISCCLEAWSSCLLFFPQCCRASSTDWETLKTKWETKISCCCWRSWTKSFLHKWVPAHIHTHTYMHTKCVLNIDIYCNVTTKSWMRPVCCVVAVCLGPNVGRLQAQEQQDQRRSVPLSHRHAEHVSHACLRSFMWPLSNKAGQSVFFLTGWTNISSPGLLLHTE